MKTKNTKALRYRNIAFIKKEQYVEVYKSYLQDWPVFIGVLFLKQHPESAKELYLRAKSELPKICNLLIE